MNSRIFKCLPSTNKVGVEFNKDIINIYFPAGYDIPKESNEIVQKSSILDILKTISLCKNNGEGYEYNYNSGEEKEIPINSYLWLLNDYLKNGLYNVKEKHYIVSQKGKINWKRTFETKPFFSNNEIVYLNPKVEINTKTDNIITEIHAICINICIDKIGWLFGDFERCDGYKQSLSDEMYIDILNRELLSSFEDKKKTLLNHLIKVLSNLTDNDQLDYKNDLLVDNYHYAWEVMIRKIFGNDNDNLKKYFPKIEWRLKYSKEPKPSMRPDSVINKGDTLYIIDAKYYRYGVDENGSLPGAEDVDKQITYGEFNNKNFEQVYNAFVMPYNKNDNRFKNDKIILDIGNVQNNARIYEENKETFRKVAAILIDTKYVIDCYFKREKKLEKELIESIINSIKYNSINKK